MVECQECGKQVERVVAGACTACWNDVAKEWEESPCEGCGHKFRNMELLGGVCASCEESAHSFAWDECLFGPDDDGFDY